MIVPTHILDLQVTSNGSTILKMFYIAWSSIDISTSVDLLITRPPPFFSSLRVTMCNFRWYDLKSKAGKEKSKPRGELEVRVAFLVKAGSLTDLSKKPHRSSMGHLSHMAHSVGKCEIEVPLMWNHLCFYLFGSANTTLCFRRQFAEYWQSRKKEKLEETGQESG